MTDTIDYPLFKRAIEICTERGVLNQAYLKAVIKKWTDRNITTYDQLQAYELQAKANENKPKEESGKFDSIKLKDEELSIEEMERQMKEWGY